MMITVILILIQMVHNPVLSSYGNVFLFALCEKISIIRYVSGIIVYCHIYKQHLGI